MCIQRMQLKLKPYTYNLAYTKGTTINTDGLSSRYLGQQKPSKVTWCIDVRHKIARPKQTIIAGLPDRKMLSPTLSPYCEYRDELLQWNCISWCQSLHSQIHAKDHSNMEEQGQYGNGQNQATWQRHCILARNDNTNRGHDLQVPKSAYKTTKKAREPLISHEVPISHWWK